MATEKLITLGKDADAEPVVEERVQHKYWISQTKSNVNLAWSFLSAGQ
jgi:hypothetical protein